MSNCHVTKMKRTPIQKSKELGIANLIRGAVIVSRNLASGQVAFAGGAPRDLMDGVLPKDFDLIVPRCAFNRPVYDGPMCRTEAAGLLNELMADLISILGEDVTVLEFAASMTEPNQDYDERILAAGSVMWRGVTVDVLFSSADNLMLALDGFDSDINQAFIDANAVYSVDVGSYKMLRPARSECRYHKLLAVAQRRGTHLERYEGDSDLPFEVTIG